MPGRLKTPGLQSKREVALFFGDFDYWLCCVVYSPDNPGTVYKHTQLLLKLSSEKEAAANWLRFRGIQLQHTKDVGAIKKALR